MAIDLSKLGGASSGGALPVAGGTPTPPPDPNPIDFSAPSTAPSMQDPNETNGHNWIWDKFGRALFGDQNNTQDRGAFGGIPVVGDIARAPGVAWRGLLDAGGVGLDKGIIQPLAEAMGRIPSGTHVADNYGLGDPNNVGRTTVNLQDPKYRADPRDPISVGRAGAQLAQDINAAHGQSDMATQFLLLGQWQKQYDPQAFADWQKTLAAAQAGSGGGQVGTHAGEMLSSYIRDWSVAYMDTTPDGVEGWLGVHPELAFAGEGSLGQGFKDDLDRIFTLQRHAEVGAAAMSGSGGGGIGPIPVGPHLYYGDTDYGSRLNELLHTADANPKDLTPVEAAVVAGIKTEGWTTNHAYNYLAAHGQGYSHNPGVETVLGMALDPTMVIPTGAALTAHVGEAAALGYAKTAIGASRITEAYQGMARAIGTTVAAVRADPILGPAMKVARTVWDPLSALPAGTKQAAKTDVYAAAGLKATERGFGPGAVKDMFNRAEGWGVRDMADRAFGTTAMNFMRKFAIASHIDNLTKFADPGARRAVSEDLIQEIGHNAPKDAVSRGADYVYKRREFWLSDAGTQQLTDRIATATRQPVAEVAKAVASMSRDEQAVWHAMSYSEAFTDFVTAARSVPPEEWGSLAKKLDDTVILNPHELDNVAAQTLHADISALKGAKAVKAWNEAAGRYSLIENLGRITTGGQAQLARRLNALDRIIQEGGLHTALSADELKALPEVVKRDFLGKWVGSDGQPLWRIGFKPNALQATGLVYDDAGKLIAKYEPAIDNVTTAIPRTVGAVQSITDAVGRAIPDGVKDLAAAKAAGRLADSLEVGFNVARDKVSSERVMTSMEQSFVKQMRSAGHSGQLARNIFRQTRTAAQGAGFTLAGMNPEEFYAANEELLKDVVDARVAKRDIFNMMARAAGGDMRLLGISSGATQRIRSGLIARGLDPNNYLGAVTVKTYNTLRYALNPTFFLQAEFDAPWFNMYRGVLFDLRGRTPLPGSKLWEMQGITEAMGHTSISRDLQMDYTERIATIGWQREVVDQLKDVPGFEQGLGQRIKGRLGRMVMNNELLFLNSETGNIVHDAINTTKKALETRAAAAATPEEAAMWRNQGLDIERVFDHITETLHDELGRLPTPDEMGRRYLSEMIDDSKLEVRTREGLLDYQKVAQKGAYHVPTDIGELRPLHMDYGAESLALPNIHNAATLKAAIRDGVYTVGDVRDIMKSLGYHPDHIQRFVNGITFNWRHYFDGLKGTLGMNRFEMQGIEDMVAKEARSLGMEPVDYLSQVLPVSAGKKTLDVAGMGDHMKALLDISRAANGADMEQLTRVVAGHLQPSMKQALLDHFMQRVTGKNGLIETAMAAGDTKGAQDLNLVLEDLKGGWGKAAEDEFRDLVIRRAGGHTPTGGANTPFKAAPGIPGAEMVPTSMLDRFIEIDREAVAKGGGLSTDLEALTADIKANGIKEPITLEYDPHTGSALVTDGNHRLAAAKRAGMNEVPVRLEPAKRLPSEADLTKAPAGFVKTEVTPGAATKPSDIFKATREIADPEVERAARYFSQYVQSLDPKLVAGDVLRGIVDNIPVEGASPYHFTQGVLMNTLAENFRLAEKDAIRLAHMSTERSVLERSINHPFFAMYPSSYFWGKVIPETFRFMATDPFGIKTGLGLNAYYHVKQSADLQGQYDPRMAALWKSLGKSAVVGLLSYLSPSMPWEDMKSSLPPWVRSLSKGEDFATMLDKETDTFAPHRWVSHFTDAAKEVGDGISSVVKSISPQQQQDLQQISGQAPEGGATPQPVSHFQGTVKGTALGPVLQGDLADLQAALSK